MGNYQTQLKLSPKLKQSFDHFVSLANKSGLHPLDWARFYDFIVCSYRFSRSKVSEWHVKRLLVETGFNEERASELAIVYQHGRGIIVVFKGGHPEGLSAKEIRARLRDEIAAADAGAIRASTSDQ